MLITWSRGSISISEYYPSTLLSVDTNAFKPACLVWWHIAVLYAVFSTTIMVPDVGSLRHHGNDSTIAVMPEWSDILLTAGFHARERLMSPDRRLANDVSPFHITWPPPGRGLRLTCVMISGHVIIVVGLGYLVCLTYQSTPVSVSHQELTSWWMFLNTSWFYLLGFLVLTCRRSSARKT